MRSIRAFPPEVVLPDGGSLRAAFPARGFPRAPASIEALHDALCMIQEHGVPQALDMMRIAPPRGFREVSFDGGCASGVRSSEPIVVHCVVDGELAELAGSDPVEDWTEFADEVSFRLLLSRRQTGFGPSSCDWIWAVTPLLAWEYLVPVT